jgi:hypothetical protein
MGNNRPTRDDVQREALRGPGPGDFNGEDLTGLNLAGCVLMSCRFAAAILSDCNLSGAILSHSQMAGATLKKPI